MIWSPPVASLQGLGNDRGKESLPTLMHASHQKPRKLIGEHLGEQFTYKSALVSRHLNAGIHERLGCC